MAQNAPQPTGSGREIALLVGVLLIVGAATIGTYWIRSRAEASGKQPPAAATTAQTPRPRVSAPAPTTAEGDVVHADVYFDFKSTRLRADAARVLQETTSRMDLGNSWVVLVQGYTDSQGPAEYNRSLAQRRALVVKRFLVDLGMPEPAIKMVTMGQEGTLCDDPSKECQELNRRVHLEFRKLAAASPAEASSPAGDR